MKKGIFLFIIISLLLLISCSPTQLVGVDSITTKDFRVYTQVDEITLYQQGLAVTIVSLDFDVNKKYGVTITSPLQSYSWHALLSPVKKDTISSLVIEDLLMPSLTPFPSGVYTLDILLDDTSFVKSSFEYERNSNEKKLEPIAYAIEEIDGSFTISFSPEIDGNVTIELYDASHSLLLTLKDLFTNEKLNDESFRESIDYIIIYSNNDIYRIIL